MYPSKPNANAAGSNQDSDTSKLTAPSSASGQKHGSPMDFSFQLTDPTAPLLPFTPYNQPAQNMEPPPYSSVIPQASSDWKNHSSSFSGPKNLQPYPSGPSPAPGVTNQTPYPMGGFSSYGLPGQALLRTGPGAVPEFAGNPPYPTGPGFGSGVTIQPPFYTRSGYIPRPVSQAPYSVASTPIFAPVDTAKKASYSDPVTMEPKSSNSGYPPGVHRQRPVGMQTTPYPVNGNQQGLIYPTMADEKKQCTQTSQYVSNQYVQQQQPNTVYVVHKTEPDHSVDDDRCFWTCCLAACYCLAECIKASAS